MASYLCARANNGEWYLRIDDIDPPREQAGAAQTIIDTLAAFGFKWDHLYYQHDRHSFYQAALHRLNSEGHCFNCACSRKDLAAARAGSQRNTTVYPGSCRSKNLPESDTATRFRVSGCIQFTDQLQGEIQQILDTEVGDFVIKRKDGLVSYQLANVVDDALDGITHVVRGADLLDNTPRQIALIRALGYPQPEYMHVPIVTNKIGQKLSKQTQAPALQVDQALMHLLCAWELLGQTYPPSAAVPIPTTNIVDCESIEDFWMRAVRHWEPRRIPRLLGTMSHSQP